MIIPALVLSALTQIPSPKPDYSVPMGASKEFMSVVSGIKNALKTKDYAQASKLSGLLPKKEVTFRIDAKNLNSDQSVEFQNAIRGAAGSWEQVLNHQVTFNFVSTPNADISFSFEPILAKISGTDKVAGATWFLATEPSQPFVEAVIGLKRGPKFDKIVGREVMNESLFTFGRYLGLAPNPIYGTAMGRLDEHMTLSTAIFNQEAIAAAKVLTLSDLLRTAVKKKESIDTTAPAAVFDRKSLKFEPRFQGDEGRAQILITNTGTAPLELSVRGDCGCITGQVAPVVEPGKSTMLTGIFITGELNGDVHHNLIVTTNDAEQPILVVPVSITVNPRAEFIFPESSTLYLDGKQRTFIFYIHSAEPKVFKIVESGMSDKSLTTTIEPFQGEVANYAKAGKKQKINGYKVVVDTSKFPAEVLFGRASAMLFIKTDNPKLPIVRGSFYLQRGIVCLPESVFLGSPKGAMDFGFIVTRPARPFAIKKVSSDSKFLTFEVTKNDAVGSDYFIKVFYDGKAPGNRLKAEILIQTDDPKNPVVRVPIQTSGV